jgi:hypothetical protein
MSQQYQDHAIPEPILVAGMLENCEDEVRMLRSQLALKERANQRLIQIEQEQAVAIDTAQTQAAIYEQTIRYAQETFRRLPFDFGSNDFYESCDQIEREVVSLQAEVAAQEAAASV